MKILLISERIQEGGAKVFLESLLRLYKKNNWKVTLLTEKNGLSIAEKYKKNHLISQFKIYGKREFIYKFFPFSLLFDKQIFKRINTSEYDVIVVSNQHFGINLGAFLLNQPLLFIFHTYPHKTNPINKILISHYLEKHIDIKKRIITVSKYSKDIFKNEFINNPKKHPYVSYIYNSAFGIKNRISTELNKDSRNLVLTIGNLAWYKNPDVWIEVAKKNIIGNKNINFVWIGDGSKIEEYRRKVPNDSKNRIKFIGQVDHKKIATYLNRSLIYFQPSILESHGISVVEAMKMGIPCVVSNAGGLPESVGNGFNGFISNDNDIDDYDNNINVIIRDNKLWTKMSKNALKKYKTKFSYKGWETKMTKIHHSLCKR